MLLLSLTLFKFTDPRFFAFDIAPVASTSLARLPSAQDVDSILRDIFDGLLLAVPKKRRSIAKRLSMKFGVKKWAPHGWKMIDPKTNIITCWTCGNYHEAQYLCEHCYGKNMEETQVIQKNILEELGYDINDKEVKVLYRGDTRNDDQENIRFVEIPKERPQWFSRNLLSKPASETSGPSGNVVISGKRKSEDQ